MAGGIDWLRWHHGSTTDPKFALVAKRAGVRTGDVAMFRAHNFVPRIAKQYAARHGYQVEIETQDEPLAVRADLGTLYRVVRL